MCQFDLKAPFPRLGAFTEYLQDKSSPVEDLRAQSCLEISLLYGRDGVIKNHQFRFVNTNKRAQFIDLAGTDQRRRNDPSAGDRDRFVHGETNRLRQPDGLFAPRFQAATGPFRPIADIRYDNQSRSFGFDRLSASVLISSWLNGVLTPVFCLQSALAGFSIFRLKQRDGLGRHDR